MESGAGPAAAPDWPQLDWTDDEPPPEHHWLDNPPTIGAVIVAHNGAHWLPKVLQSFSDMFYAPTAWCAVDVGSTDGGAELLRDAFGAERIVYAPSGTGFGEAVREGVARLPQTDWLWLLHDDAAVLPGTLAGLLDIATSADDIAVVGPKVREWPSLKRLLEVGVSITNTGSRETGLEAGEPDAGQHDWPRDVLAVSSAGMLVRRDVWEQLDGFDPALPMYFDDIDFGWRVARAGFRTRTAPSAVIFHAEASWRGTRRAVAGDVPDHEARRAAIYTLLVNCSTRRFLWQSIRLFLGSLLRFFGFALGKDPESASDELLALRSVYSHPFKIRAARRWRAQQAIRATGEFTDLFPPFWLPYRHGFDAVVDAIITMVRPETVEAPGHRSTADAGQARDDAPERPTFAYRRPWLLTWFALLIVALVADRDLFHGASEAVLHGGALPPTPEGTGSWWSMLFERSHDIGLGSAALAPVYLVPLVLAASIVWPFPGLITAGIMLFAVPLAGLAAHRLGRRLMPYRRPRIVWAVAYALSVAGLGAVAQGRIGTVVALIALPIAVNTALQLVELPTWQKGVRLGIWIAVASAFAPISFALSVAGLILLVALEGRAVLRGSVVAVVTAAALLGPSLVQRAGHPFRMWWEAGFAIPGPVSALELLFGHAGGVSAPVWFSIALPVLASLALVPRRSRHHVVVCWYAGLVALAFGVLGSSLSYTTPAGPGPVAAWVGVPMGLWVGSMLTAVLFAAPEVGGLPRPALVGLAVLVLLLPVGTGTWWVIRGAGDPLAMSPRDAVPAFLVVHHGSTLVVTGSVQEGAEARVLNGSGLSLGEEAMTPSRARSQRLQEATARLLARPSRQDVGALAELGIGAIYLPHADRSLVRRVDGAPGLEPAGSDSPDSRVWLLTDEPRVVKSRATRWRWLIGGAEVGAWLMAIVLTAPVHRRRTPSTLEDDDA
ncbi:MAG TPA: glycosyltransferase family 2 protein [Aeromicrobium sp.]|nr:glycosyltransferase family 2 protein [Aeromicrobium sp.]